MSIVQLFSIHGCVLMLRDALLYQIPPGVPYSYYPGSLVLLRLKGGIGLPNRAIGLLNKARLRILIFYLTHERGACQKHNRKANQDMAQIHQIYSQIYLHSAINF
jgi:hypothetical protein